VLARGVFRAGGPAGAPAEMRRQERSSSAFATRTGSLVS
jgi:hypothetical protein